MSDFVVRRATASDASTLATFGAHCFRDWFGPMNEPADVDAHLANTFSPARQAAELADSGTTYFLALRDTQPCAYAMLVADTPHPHVSSPRAALIQRFYVDRPWHGQGLASTLMETVCGAARQSGHSAVWLTAWEENPRALAFYEKMGFADAGWTIFQLGSSPQRDRILVRAL